MASSSLIVNVVITKSTRVVTQQAFSIPCIFGPSNRLGGDPYAVYNSYTEMVQPAGPFEASDPEAIEALALTSQAIVPTTFVVAPNTAAVAQVDTFALAAAPVTGNAYGFTLNSIPLSYTAQAGDTQQVVLAALLAALATAFPTNPPVSGAVTGAGAGALLTLSSLVAGIGVSYVSISANLVHVAVTANHSISQDIEAAQLAVTQEAQFYGVIVCSHVASDILQVAKYIETQLLVYVTATADAACLTNAATDIMSQLKSLELDRTMIMYSAEANTNGPDGAWMGYMLPTTPGAGNWAMKTLAGVDADNLNPTQIANIVSKRGNMYVPLGGNGTTLYGITPGGEYFDVTIFLDWLASSMQTAVVQVETDPLNLKIPYTNAGIGMIENAMRSVLRQGQDNGGLVAGWSLFAPDANAVPYADRLNRVLNNVGFNAQLAGAINTINIQGFVSS